jgi:hypothetical protein
VIIKIIEKYGDLIASWKIIEYDQDGPNLRLKAEFEFTDRSRFVVRQVVLKEFTFKYAIGRTRKANYAADGIMRRIGQTCQHIPIINTSCLAIKFLLKLREVETWMPYLMRLRNIFQMFSVQACVNEE